MGSPGREGLQTCEALPLDGIMKSRRLRERRGAKRDNMLKWLFRKKKPNLSEPQAAAWDDASATLELTGRTIRKLVVPVPGASILELADRNGVDWMSNCKRGTCARCRCLVQEGMEFLSEPNPAEIDRLEEEELAQGYRLGCQVRIKEAGNIVVKHASYF
jgi:2Fe-2S ferredoxin